MAASLVFSCDGFTHGDDIRKGDMHGSQARASGSKNKIPHSEVDGRGKLGVDPNKISSGSKGHSVSWVNIIKRGTSCDKKLEYIPPYIQESGIPRIQFSKDVIQEGSQYWRSTLVGYFIENHLSFQVVRSLARKLWQQHGLIEVYLTTQAFTSSDLIIMRTS